VRSRVNNGVANEIVWEIWIIGVSVEGKLKNAGSGQLELIPQRADVRSYKSEILSDEGQAAELFLHCLEER
jgi:hypothetical protein